VAVALGGMINIFSVSDAALAVCCVLVALMVSATDKVPVSRRPTIVAVMVASAVMAIINLLVDASFVVPPRRFLVIAIYIAGGSKGLVLGWLSGLLLFKQLRRDRAAEIAAA
jgi:hypothetical protein